MNTGNVSFGPNSALQRVAIRMMAGMVWNLDASILLPLIEAVSGYQAASALEWNAVGWHFRYRLDPGIDCGIPGLRLF